MGVALALTHMLAVAHSTNHEKRPIGLRSALQAQLQSFNENHGIAFLRRYPRQLSTCKEAGRSSWARVERGLDGGGTESGASLEGRRASNFDGTLSQKEKKLKLHKGYGNLERAFCVLAREEIE